jgi:hypothetical protein
VESEADAVTLRLGILERWILSTYFLIAFCWIGVYELTLADVGERLIGAVCIAIGLVGFWELVVRIKAVVGSEHLLVRNPLRTHVLALGDIASVDPEYEGLRIRTIEGRRLTVVAVQRYNVALFLRRRSRADDVKELIQRRRASVGGRRDVT